MSRGDGVRLALTWFTVAPVRGPATVDRVTAGAALRWAPVVGAVLGTAAVGVAAAVVATGGPPVLAGLLAVGLLAALTRGMHLDGLADTADGLGCYGPPERALAVMRDGGAGPFAVVALVLVLSAQAVAIGELVADGRWVGVVVAVSLGRTAFGWCARLPAARPDGLGALVAGTHSTAVAAGWTVATAVGAVVVVPGRPWQGPLVVLVAVGATVLLARHCVRRFGGVSGDVFGACAEAATTITLVGVVLG